MVLNSFTAANDYHLTSKWLNGHHVFLPTDKTFKGICLAIVENYEFFLHLKPFCKKLLNLVLSLFMKSAK